MLSDGIIAFWVALSALTLIGSWIFFGEAYATSFISDRAIYHDNTKQYERDVNLLWEIRQLLDALGCIFQVFYCVVIVSTLIFISKLSETNGESIHSNKHNCYYNYKVTMMSVLNQFKHNYKRLLLCYILIYGCCMIFVIRTKKIYYGTEDSLHSFCNQFGSIWDCDAFNSWTLFEAIIAALLPMVLFV